MPALDDLDAFLEGVDRPVFVVTAADGADRDGCLVGFATQTSIDSPRLLVCLSVANRTFRIAQGADVLAVHLRGKDDHDAAEHWGGETGDERDKLAGVRWHPGPGGVPLLDDLPRRLVGRVVERLPLGDHVGHLLEPLAERTLAEDDTLTYRDVDDIDAGHPA